jgi:hypothetical protein
MIKLIKNIIQFFKDIKRAKQIVKNLNKEISKHEKNLFIAKRYQLNDKRFFEEEIIDILTSIKNK